MNRHAMDCKTVEKLLPLLLTGQLDHNRQGAVEEHLTRCDACGHKLAEMLGAGQPMNEDDVDGFVAGVVNKTSGPACGRVRESVCMRADGGIDDLTEAMRVAHTAHCADCRRFTAKFEWIMAELPLWREMEPDGAFVRDVLLATSHAAGSSFWKRFAAGVDRLLLRPLIAWEFAYTMTVILVLSVRLSGTPIHAIHPSVVPVFDGSRIVRVYADTGEMVKNFGQQVTEEGSAQSRSVMGKVGDIFQEYKQKTLLSVEKVKNTGRAFKTSVTEKRIEPAVMEVVGWWNSIAEHLWTQPENNDGGHNGTSGETGV